MAKHHRHSSHVQQKNKEEPDSIENADKIAEMKQMKKESEIFENRALQNPFSGHIVRENGKREFWDGSGEVGGVNNYHQMHKKTKMAKKHKYSSHV